MENNKSHRENEENRAHHHVAKLALMIAGFNHVYASLERLFMDAMTGPQILLAFAAAGLALLLVPTSFNFRGFLFLLLTGTGILLGVGLSLGNVTRLFN